MSVKRLRISEWVNYKLELMRKNMEETNTIIKAYAPEREVKEEDTGSVTKDVKVGHLAVVLVRNEEKGGNIEPRVCRAEMIYNDLAHTSDSMTRPAFIGLVTGEMFFMGFFSNLFGVSVVRQIDIREVISMDTLREKGLTKDMIQEIESRKFDENIKPVVRQKGKSRNNFGNIFDRQRGSGSGDKSASQR